MMNNPKHTFFSEDIDRLILSEEESKHALRVLRLKMGDTIKVIDGKGRMAICEISKENKNGLEYVILEEKNEVLSNLHIHIAIAPTKNSDRIQFFIEKSTEIGINEISLLQCEHSERTQIKTEKLRKNLIAAIKQSGQLYLPEIHELKNFKDFVSKSDHTAEKFIAHCEEDAEKIELKTAWQGGKKVIILIGPEGDFSPEEIILAKENKYLPVSLGNGRLRTETAGIVACHTLHVIS